MTTDPTDEELCVQVAKALDWKWYKFTRENGTFFCQLIEPTATWPTNSYFNGIEVECPSGDDPDASGTKKWATSVDAALELVEAMRAKGYDLRVNRDYASGTFLVQFVNEEHVFDSFGDTLPLAIVRAFLAAQGESTL